jgi:alkylhydroperoxidase family enzyme
VEELRACAPTAFAAWDEVQAAAGAGAGAATRAVLTRRVRELLRIAGADGIADGSGAGAADDLPPAVGAFVDQFVVDVGSMTAPQRDQALAVLGAGAFELVQVLYVVDLGERMDAAWRQVFGVTDPVARAADGGAPLWPALESFMRAVARLDALDPVTTEVVRLRGARAHGCRLCQSLRNVRAAAAGADESLYDQVDHHADPEASLLDPRHRQALRLVDAMLWEPGHHPAGLADDLHATFTDAELVEIVFDVARNAANKVAVAFGADDPHVTDGLEFYDVDAAGDLVYGLAPPAG